MFPYWVLFSLASVGALEERQGRTRGGILIVAIALFILVMVGLRYRVGADWYSYENMFKYYNLMSFDEVLRWGDPGYAVLNWTAHQLDLEIWFVNIICAAVFSWGLLRFAKVQPNPALGLVVAIPYLVIVVAMGYTRQAVAIGVVLAGLATVGRSPLYRFVLYVAVAALFHKSAVIVLPLVALAAARGRVMTAAILVASTALLYYVVVSGAAMDRMMTVYIDAEYNSQGAAIRVLMNLPPALIFIFGRKRFNLSPEEERLWLNFSIASIIALILLAVLPSSTVVDRLALYLIPLQLVVFSRIPYAFSKTGNRNGQVVVGVIVYYALIQFVWLGFAEHSKYWVPYRLFPFGSSTADTEIPSVS